MAGIKFCTIISLHKLIFVSKSKKWIFYVPIDGYQLFRHFYGEELNFSSPSGDLPGAAELALKKACETTLLFLTFFPSLSRDRLIMA
jgi:hypothetical protein